jgi:hypothetical protein
MRKSILHLAAVPLASAALLGGPGAAAAPQRSAVLSTQGPLPPVSELHARVDNPWFPLRPGTRYRYTGVKDGKPSREVLTVTHRVEKVQGAPCVVIDDRLYVEGTLEERTTDWYSQDSRGNVWYFGENTAELDARGHITSTEGTWTAGVHGAKPGIYMPAHPRFGQTAEQEYYKGHAEDHFKVIGLFGTVSPPGTKNTLLTQETTPLEPGTVDHNMYVRGIGTVLEQTERGPNERNELVSVTRGA